MSDRLKGLAKGGWHPKGKDGGQESWRGDYKGINTVAGWMGKGRDTSFAPNEEKLNHQSQPLSSLQDPTAFGPPPKHVAAGGSAGQSSPSLPARQSTRSTPAARPATRQQPADEPQWQSPDTSQEENERAAPPHVPYRKDTTGLSTSGLPVPPVRRGTPQGAPGTRAVPSKPAPPPRLPPRQNSHPDVNSPEPPPSYSAATTEPPDQASVLNPGALSRLGKAGVSVPGLGIGRGSGNSSPQQSSPTSSGHLSGLSDRFGRMATSSTDQQQPSSSQGTSWAQKQKAAQTAAAFHKDPSAVSFSDAKDAASTANNFRQRHGEQINSGWKAASGLNQKYGVSDKVKGWQTGEASSPVQEPTPTARPAAHVPEPSPVSPVSVPTGGQGKRPPPPPPKKRQLQPNAAEQPAQGDAPPPIPLSSKPR